MKREGDSFSNVVERISEEQDLEKFSGAFPEIGEVENQLEKERRVRNEVKPGLIEI